MSPSVAANLFALSPQGYNQAEPLSPEIKDTLSQYFEALNQEEFALAASLFTPTGALVPPFEQPKQGSEAIQAYLEKEAVGLTLEPKSWEKMAQGRAEANESSEGKSSNAPSRSAHTVKVKGKVKTPLFTVNVAWLFNLSHDAMIERVEVQLLASLAELMGMRNQA